MIAGLYSCFDHWHRQGTVYIYSDPHFSDKEIPNRPSDEEQIKLINSKVGRKDTLVILGDVGNIEYVRRLKGYKILICGNHDVGATNYKRQVVHEKFDRSIYSRQEAIAKMKEQYPDYQVRISGEGYSFHSPFEYWTVEADNRLFDEVYSGPLMISEKLILSHEPINVPWAFNIHGHIHDRRHKNDKYHFNCCAEAINFTPINFNQWMKQGYLSKIETIHRSTIDEATKRKKNRKGKK